MELIDAHNHIWNEPGYLDRLIETMDRLGIARVCVSGLGPVFGQVGDDEIKQAVHKFPDRVIGQVYVRPGVDGPDKIDWAFNEGFRMVKVTAPRAPYNDPSFFPLWERALDRAMPVLFHTGTVTTAGEAPQELISSWDMNPMRIEPVTRAFPELKIIVAHLGIHWNDDAAELARMRPNVYVDLTGEPGGWRVRADRVGVDRWLWWPGALDKVVFGSDVHYSKMALILEQDEARLNRLNASEETKRRIFSGNILKMLESSRE